MSLYRLLIRWVVLTVWVGSTATVSGALHAPAPPEFAPPALHTGVLLVAREHMLDRRFHKTVILITQHGRQGAIGLIINRPSTLKLTQALPNLSTLRLSTDVIFLGGPVEPHDLFFLSQGEGADALRPVMDGLHFGTGVLALHQAISATLPGNGVRAYAGYAGWAPGQLENELAHGDWLLVPADPQAVFSAQPEQLWTQLIKTWSGLWL